MFRLNKISLASAAMMFLTAASAADAESVNGRAVPDPDDLRFYVGCNALAEERPLSYGEAADCSVVIQRLKLSFVPDMSLETFNGLAPAERARINLAGYRAFRQWIAENATDMQALEAELVSTLVPVTD